MDIKQLLEETKSLRWQDKILFIAKNGHNITFSTSFSIEDQIILKFIHKHQLPITIFTIDTGRLPNLTYKIWQETIEKYKVKIKAYYPDSVELSDFVNDNGVNSFYHSEDLRHKCCEIRKVNPLKKALKNKEIWISGIRRAHSSNRENKEFFEYDDNLDIVKFYPLLELNEEEVWNYIRKYGIIYNKLYDKGYRSIGCDPCSRAVTAEEDIRDGRWWWEANSKKECGLHIVNNKLVRKNNNSN